MKRRIVSLDKMDFLAERQAILDFANRDLDFDGPSAERLVRIVRFALDKQLTDRQRILFAENVFYGCSVKKLADKYGLCPSTVSRHIRRAKEKINRTVDINSLRRFEQTQ